MSFKPLLNTIIILSALASSIVYAATPSAAQIEQFNKLPESQQKALAKSMGYDLDALKAQANGSSQEATEQTFEQPVEKREIKPQIVQSLNGEAQELMPFGYDVFANAPTTFTPNLDVAVPESYIVGPGDKVTVQLFGKENLDHQLTVNREGQVVIPELGPFEVVGLSYSELKQFLKSKIQQRILGVNVVVSISSLRSMRIFVLGDAYKPGPYTVNSLSSVTHAIFAAGGISEIGSLRNIQIKRAGKLIQTFDLYDLLIKGDSRGDILLHAGDVVFVAPVGNRISIDGEVRRPGLYEIATNETFKEAISMAGGLLPSAYPKATRVERYNANNLRSVKNIDLSSHTDSNATVKNGDAIHVLKTSDVYDQSIEIIGAAARPGTFQWVEGQRISDIFPSFDAYVLEDTDLSYSIIVREIDLARNVEILQFKLSEALHNPQSVDNITLQARDKIILFSNTEVTLSFNKKRNMRSYGDKVQSQFGTDEQPLETELDLAKQAEEDEKSELQFLAELRKKGIEDLTKENDGDSLVIEELKENARFKLLAPVIEKLKQQGSAGQPMQLVEVDGQVKYPGVYPLAVNSKVSSLVIAAGGITESAYLARAEITRNTIEDEHARKISLTVNLKDALANISNSDIAIKSKDRLNVHTIPSWSENHTVTLNGEFMFPGKYTIRRGETLADIIEKAGGFTEYAFPEGSVFTREKLKKLEVKNLENLAEELRLEIASKALTEGTEVTYEEAQKLLSDLTDIDPVGRLVLNIPKVIQQNDYDVLLEGGDALYVPTKNNSINIVGQINVSTSHIYDSHLSVEDYIRKSGGVKQRAQVEGIYVIAANGDIKTIEEANWFSSGEYAQLKPGDTIVVPLDSSYMTDITLWSTATQIMYNTAVAIAAISGL